MKIEQLNIRPPTESSPDTSRLRCLLAYTSFLDASTDFDSEVSFALFAALTAAGKLEEFAVSILMATFAGEDTSEVCKNPQFAGAMMLTADVLAAIQAGRALSMDAGLAHRISEPFPAFLKTDIPPEALEWAILPEEDGPENARLVYLVKES